jgi:hypothetical protein
LGSRLYDSRISRLASEEQIRPMPAGGLSVPSCSQPGRSYRVSLAGEGRCGCADWRRRKQPCKHLFAALVWAAKQRRALILAGRRAARR